MAVSMRKELKVTRMTRILISSNVTAYLEVRELTGGGVEWSARNREADGTYGDMRESVAYPGEFLDAVDTLTRIQRAQNRFLGWM